MAGDWIKWTKGLTRKSEVIQMAASLNLSRQHVCSLLMEMWEWADDNATIDEVGNGFVTVGALQPTFLDALLVTPGFAKELTSVGWLNARNGRLFFPNFGRHNGETAKSRALTQKRVQKNRNANTVTDVTQTPLPEKRREEKNLLLTEEEGVDWSGLPNSLNTDAFKSAWEGYVAYRRSSKIKKLKPISVTGLWKELETWGHDGAIQSIQQTIRNGWQGLFAPKPSEAPTVKPQQTPSKYSWNR